MKRIVLTLILFASLFTSNLYSNTSEIPNEKVFDNPKKEVTTIEAKKNKEHAEMNIKVNKLSIQEIKGYNIGEGKTQYFIPKEEKENKLLKNLTNNTENQYLIFETKEQLSDYLNKNKKARNKRDVANPIQYEVMQDENQTMLTVNSSAELYILENDNKIYKGSTYAPKVVTRGNYRKNVMILGYKDVLNTNEMVAQFCNLSYKGLYQIQGGFEYQLGNSTSDVQLKVTNNLSFNPTSMVGGGFVPGSTYREDKSSEHYQYFDVLALNYATSGMLHYWPWYTGIRGEVRYKLSGVYNRYGDHGIVHSFTHQILYYGGSTIYSDTYDYLVSLFITRKSQNYTIDITHSDLDSERKLSIYDQKIDSVLKYSELDDTYIASSGFISSSKINIDSSRKYLIFPRDLETGHYEVKGVLFDGFSNTILKDPVDIITIRYNAEIPTTNKTLDLTRAIPEKQYIIDLSNGIGKTQEYIDNRSLDPNIHQIDLEGGLDLSGASKAELWVDGINYENAYSCGSYAVRVEGKSKLYITRKKHSGSGRTPQIELRLCDNLNFKRAYRIYITNPPSNNRRVINYEAQIDPRFFKVMKQEGDNKLYYNGYINNKDYSALFKKTNESGFDNIQSIASINQQYGITNSENLVTYNGYGFKKNESPLNGYKALSNSVFTQDTVNLQYLGTDNFYQNLVLNLIKSSSSINMDKVYVGQGNIDLSTAQIDNPYIFTKDNLNNNNNNNNGLVLENSNDFITTGTAFNTDSDIVNRITVNDKIEMIHEKTYKDSDVEITLGKNSLSIKKLRDFTKSKTLKIDYYYNKLKLGTYTLTLTCTPVIKLEGIDSINFGTLIPEKTSSLQSNFTVKSLTGANITLKVPTDSQMTQKGATSKTNNTIPLKIESTQENNGNNINGWLRVSATPPKGTTPGEYEGTINLTVTIE